MFLWHFPWGRPRRALPGTVFPWSPDFPRPDTRRAAIRPSGVTTLGDWGGQSQMVQAEATAAMRARVSASGTPSQRTGRKWRWKATRT